MTKARQQSWSRIKLDNEAGNDSLLGCLVLMTRYFKNPFTAKSLVARLPVVNGHLTLDLFERAAKRASLEAELIELPVDALNAQDHPMIILLQDNAARLLIKDDQGECKVIDPVHPDTWQPLDSVMELYQGKAINLQKEFKHTERAAETLNQGKKDWFWRVLLKAWPLYSEVLMASFLINLFALVIPLFVMNVYDRVVPNHAMATMWVLTSGVVVVFIFDIILKALRSYFLDVASKHTDLELSASIFQQVLGLRMTDRPKSVGSLANTVQSFEIFRDFITSGTMTVLVDLPFMIIFLLVIYFIGGPLVIIPLLIIPVIFIVGISLQWPLVKLTQRSYQIAAEKQATLFEALSIIETVKTTGAESNLQSRWEEIIKQASDNNMKLKTVANSSYNITALAQQLSTIALVIYGVYLITEGELTMGALIACTILAGRAMAPMAQVAALFTRYYQSVNALKSLDKIMQLKTDIDENERYLHRPELQGNVEFRQVEFNYQDEKVAALKQVSFKIRSGEKVAIIGRVGSGKSTLARLILRLYEPTKGHIFLDDTDYRQINPDDLRQQIGYVPQDITLFYGSLKDNICIGAPFVTDQELLTAAEVAGVTQFTKHHPDGFDRQVGEKGHFLSGGQRQSVALARALLLHPHLLLLDEPTSAMDDSNERLIKNNLKNYLGPNDTLILITHKMSMLELVDRLIVMDDGKVFADGSKESVLNMLRAGSRKPEAKEQP